MRPHVELIQEDDYVWHAAELPGSEGRASERRLSVDEEDGSSSLRVDFHTDWGRGPGIHHANTEYYVSRARSTTAARRSARAATSTPPRACRPTTSSSPRAPGSCTTASTATPASTRSTRWPRHPLGRRPRGRHRPRHRGDEVGRRPQPRSDAGPVHQVPPRRPGQRLLHPPRARAGGLGGPPAGPPPLLRGGLHDPGPHGVQLRHPRPRHLLLPPGPGQARPLHHHGGRRHLAAALRRRAGQLVHPERVGALGRRGRQLRPERPRRGPAPGGPLGALHARHGAAVAHRGGHAAADRLLAVPAGPGPVRRPGRAPRLRLQQGRRRDRQGARRVQPAGRARRTRHDHDHDHGHSHDGHDHAHTHEAADLDWGWSGADTEHADERKDEDAHNWGAGRKWQQGDPIPAPILSSMPVRSRSRGRWDGDGM